MALFPTNRYPEYGYQSWHEEFVIRNDPRAPKIMAKDMWGRTRFRARMRFSFTTDYVLTVYAFWKSNRTAAFDFIDFDFDIFALDRLRDTNRVILTQTNGGGIYEAQAMNIRNYSLYVGGSAAGNIVNPANYAVTPKAGNDFMDRITFVAGQEPAAGQDLYLGHTGQRIYRCKFIATPTKESIGNGRLALVVEVAEDAVS